MKIGPKTLSIKKMKFEVWKHSKISSIQVIDLKKSGVSKRRKFFLTKNFLCIISSTLITCKAHGTRKDFFEKHLLGLHHEMLYFVVYTKTPYLGCKIYCQFLWQKWCMNNLSFWWNCISRIVHANITNLKILLYLQLLMLIGNDHMRWV